MAITRKGKDEDGPVVGVIGAEHDGTHTVEEHHGDDTGEDGRESPRGHDSRHTLEEGEFVGLLVPHDAVGTTVGDGHPDDTSHGGVGSGHGELEVGSDEKPDTGGVHHAHHAVHKGSRVVHKAVDLAAASCF